MGIPARPQSGKIHGARLCPPLEGSDWGVGITSSPWLPLPIRGRGGCDVCAAAQAQEAGRPRRPPGSRLRVSLFWLAEMPGRPRLALQALREGNFGWFRGGRRPSRNDVSGRGVRPSLGVWVSSVAERNREKEYQQAREALHAGVRGQPLTLSSFPRRLPLRFREEKGVRARNSSSFRAFFKRG